MPYYRQLNLLFIHIPKTGGTVIENELKKLYNETLFGTSFLLDYPYNTVNYQHQFYSTIYNYKNRLNIDFNNIKIFSIVRNPYDRIISDLLWWGKIKKDYTSEQVYDVIINNYLNKVNELDNHAVPQYKFITDENCQIIKNIKIFRTEKLNESNNELNKFLGCNINIQQNNVSKDYSKYLNKDSIRIINNLYKKDFEIFDYKLKSEE